jgi:hypothetical protein
MLFRARQLLTSPTILRNGLAMSVTIVWSPTSQSDMSFCKNTYPRTMPTATKHCPKQQHWNFSKRRSIGTGACQGSIGASGLSFKPRYRSLISTTRHMRRYDWESIRPGGTRSMDNERVTTRKCHCARGDGLRREGFEHDCRGSPNLNMFQDRLPPFATTVLPRLTACQQQQQRIQPRSASAVSTYSLPFRMRPSTDDSLGSTMIGNRAKTSRKMACHLFLPLYQP